MIHELTVSRLHQIIGGRLRLATLAPRHGEAALVGNIATDSRQVQRGNMFWALPGTRFDGAAFADEAFSRGAAGVVVNRYVQPWPGGWSLQVADSHAALHTLAHWNRARSLARVVAVTGSVGKTTTRQMIHAVLATQMQGTASTKNFNNHVGLPLSMLAMQPDDDFAVLELGASAPGEIGRLATLCKPQIGVITRVGDAHLGGFESVEAVAEAKAELLDALPHDGCAVLNGDDTRLRRMAPRVRGKLVWVGRALDNDIVATHIESGPGSLSFTVDGTQITVGVWGRHHLTGALAAVAVGREFGLSDEQIAEGLAQFQSLPMRCQIRRVGEATIIDDTYNSSPVAMHAALELLRDFDAPGRRIVVCGDMREMGDAAEAVHEQLGEQIVTVCGADLLLACGEQAHHVVAGACNSGMPRAAAIACRTVEDLLQHWPTELQPGDVMLVKGSRALEMERFVAVLSERGQSCAV